MAERSLSAVFQLRRAVSATQDADVLGLWEASHPAPTPTEVSFGGPGADIPRPRAELDMPEWQVSLPEDPALAVASLLDAEATLDASRRALPDAVDRLDAFVRAPADVLAFDLAAGRPQGRRPEAELALLLRQPQPADELVFATGQPLTEAWGRVGRQFQVFMDRLTTAVAPGVSVKTYLGDQCRGWTVIRWSGALDNLRPHGSGADEMALHERALELVLASRATLMRTFSLAVRGAAVLATAGTTPIGPLLALPAAWKLIDDVQAEFRGSRAGVPAISEG